MLTVPALDMLADAPAADTRRRGLFGPVFSRRPVSLGLQYDRGMVAAQIVDGLERARALRLEYAATLAYQDALGTAKAADVGRSRAFRKCGGAPGQHRVGSGAVARAGP